MFAGVIAHHHITRPTKKKFWVRPYLRKRNTCGAMNNQFRILFRQSNEEFRSFMRVDKDQFYELLNLIRDDISTNDSRARDGIPAATKLVITLRYLAAGESHQTLSLYFMVGRPTITKFIPVVLRALIKKLAPKYGKIPKTESEWHSIEREFAKRWNYSNTIGAIDGKHVVMVKPRGSGSIYHDYKGNFSTNIMAIVGPDYRFLAYDIGRPGRMSDSGIWNRSPLKPLFNPSDEYNPLHIPKPKVLANHANTPDSEGHKIKFHLVGDDGFGLGLSLMKPYPGRGLTASEAAFNYRLSRARQVVEVAFGILANRFRCLFNRVYSSPENAKLIVEACVLLHNYLISQKPPSNVDETSAREKWYPLLLNTNSRNYSRPQVSSIHMRFHIKRYFVSEYPIQSQYDNI